MNQNTNISLLNLCARIVQHCVIGSYQNSLKIIFLGTVRICGLFMRVRQYHLLDYDSLSVFKYKINQHGQVQVGMSIGFTSSDLITKQPTTVFFYDRTSHQIMQLWTNSVLRSYLAGHFNMTQGRLSHTSSQIQRFASTGKF